MSSLYCPLQAAYEKSPSFIAIKEGSFLVTYESLWKKMLRFASFLQKDPHKIYSLKIRAATWEVIACIFAAYYAGKSLFLPNVHEPALFIKKIEEKLSAKQISTFSFSSSKRVVFQGEKGSLYLMTSGSSHEPKIVILPFSSLFYNALSCTEKLQIKENDQYLLSLPLFHVSGLSILFRTFLQRATLVLLQEKKDLYSISGITHVSMVPTQLYRLLQSSSRQLASYKNFLKALLVGGAFCSYSLYEKAKDAGLPIYLSYGLSEMASQVFMTPNPVWKENNVYLGFSSQTQEVKLRQGELLLKGKNSFKGYFERPSPFTLDGWYPTKDLALFDPEYGFAILGRKDRMFISMGENVYPEEIERVILQIPGVIKARVLPKKEEEKGTLPIAYIDYENSLEHFDFISFLKERLAPYKIPQKFMRWEENLKGKTKLDF